MVFLLRTDLEYLRTNKLLLHLLIGAVLVLIYPMQALFSGNQNIYFLWIMDHLNQGAYSADPLLNSPNPYPLFSWVLSLFPVQFIGFWTAAVYIILNSVYSFSVFGIANIFGSIYNNPKRLLSFTSLFLVFHSSAIWGTYIGLQNNFDLRWIWDSGIAEQGVLRGYLQPSVFGVFLLLSFYQASQNNFVAAILCIAPAALIHANYLFLGGILTVVYLFLARFEKRAFVASIILFLAVLPYALYTANNFLWVDESVKLAIAVMDGYDSNIHLNPLNWLNPKFYLQIVLLFGALLLAWHSRVKRLFLILTSTTIGLTILAYVSHSTTLISLNPWRLSVILIPISSAILLAKTVSSSRWKNLKLLIVLGVGLISVATVYFRIFGNGSPEFMETWKTGVFIGFTALLIFTWFLSDKIPNAFKSKFEFLMIIGLVVGGLTEYYVDGKTKSLQNQFSVISQLKDQNESNTIYIIPSEWSSFRLNAGKAVFVDNNLVYGPALPALNKRLAASHKASQTGNYSEVLESIPIGTSVKLIAVTNADISESLSAEQLTESYSCFVLRK